MLKKEYGNYSSTREFLPVSTAENGIGHRFVDPEEVSNAEFRFHFNNWPRLTGTCKHASVRVRDTQEHVSVHVIYR
ncbi:hypothetical protein TNCV_1266601 [Trichonephila clavipes]|nr:hypothetical protein TNCV_1266601 [Trichonephila clavipes]